MATEQAASRQDRYHPRGAMARCPHCKATTTDAPPMPGTIERCLLFMRCPACGRGWNEVRFAGQPAVRHWDPRPREVADA
ncbi:MAG TPA: hypothetical protein VII06_43120 [Chloroflexota bacterium]|jgi:hypothetical protein